tara:strand:- start:759 stop:1013 length:255 start_codon:yes stop_codon:yes gene_type:complete
MQEQRDPELQRYFESLLDTFVSEGWKFLLEDFTGAEESIRDLILCKDDKDLYYKKGQLDVIGRLLGFETSIKNSYEDFLNDSSV